MPTERMEEVEVVRCPDCGDVQGGDHGGDGWECDACGYEGEATDRQRATAAPGSLTEARLRLADAEVERRAFSAKCAEDPESWPPDVIEQYAALSDAVVTAHAAVLSFGAALRTARGEG